MKLPATALLLAMGAFSGIAIGQNDHVAIFKYVTGTLKVVRNDANLNATSGMTLLKSDKVVSAPSASAGIVFKDGTLLTVGASSEVEIRDYVFDPRNAKYAFSRYMQKRTAIYSSGKIGKRSPESVNVATPRATVGVRGTRSRFCGRRPNSRPATLDYSKEGGYASLYVHPCPKS